MQENNIGFAILELAGEHPDWIAFEGEDATITYGQFSQLVTCFALNMQDRGIDHRSTVAMLSSNLLIVMVSVVASSLVGCRWTKASRQAIEDSTVGVTHTIRSAEMAEILAANVIEIDESWTTPPASFTPGSKAKFSGFESDTDAAFISPTSGTTGLPKLVNVSHRAMYLRSVALKIDYDGQATRFACLFPADSFPLISRCLAALLHGSTLIASADPVYWQRSGTTLIFGSPNQIAKLFEFVSLKKKLPEAMVGGGKLPESLIRELLESFDKVAENYGSTEAGRTFKTFKTLGSDGEIVSAKPLTDATVEIVTEDDTPVETGQEGIVRIRNDYLAMGYLNSPDAQATAFRDGWFYPGDIAAWGPNGELVISGRALDQLNVGGVKFYAPALDAAMMDVDGVTDAISFQFPPGAPHKGMGAFIALADGTDHEKAVEAVQAAALKIGGPKVVPQPVLLAKKLPRHPDGRPNRDQCLLTALSKRSALGG